MRRTVWLILAIVINPILVTVSQAQTNSCISPTDGFWDEARLWSLHKPPSIKQSAVLITNSTSKTVTIDKTTATNFKSTLTISNLIVSAPAGGIDTLYIDDTGTIALHILDGLTVGTTDGGSELIGSNSTVIVDGLRGGQLQDASTMVITSGLLITTNCSILISAPSSAATGLLILSNAVVQARDIIIGESGNGTMEIIGGTITLSSSLSIDGIQQSQGNLLVADGGLLVVTNGNTDIGGEIDSGATLVVSNASFRTVDVFVSGFAELMINDGTVTLNGQLAIGLGDQAAGFVSLKVSIGVNS
jgi:hypothetical protein